VGANLKNVVDGLSSYSFNNYYDKDHHDADGDLMSEGFFQCTLVSLETKKVPMFGTIFQASFSCRFSLDIIRMHMTA
jgi:hypothetical protein